MADALDAFSIRGYTANMRTVDFNNCWPFDSDEKRSQTPQLLPPITVLRSLWWGNEIEAEISRHPKPDLENIATSRHDSTVRKQKAPKKRSIADLFVAAPQIEVDDTGGADTRGKEVPNILIEEHQPQQNSAEVGDGTVVVPKDALVSTKLSRKTRRIKESVFMKLGNSRKKPKEKSRKPNSSCVVHTSCCLEGPGYKKFRKKRMGPFDSQKKKSSIAKGSSKNQTSRVTQSSNLLAKGHEEAKVFLSGNIHKKHSSTRNTTFEANSDNDNLIQPHNDSQKHVMFSRTDKSDALVASSTIKESKTSCTLRPDTVSEEVFRGNADILAATFVEESTVSSLSEKKQLDESQCLAAFTTDTTDMNFSDLERTSIAGTLDLNCAIPNFDMSDCSEFCVSALSPHRASGSSQVRNITSVEEKICVTGSQAEETFSMTSKCSIESVCISDYSYPDIAAVRNLSVPLPVSGSTVTSTATTTRDFVTESSIASCFMIITQENESGSNVFVTNKLDSPWQTRHSGSRYSKVGLEKSMESTAAQDLLTIGIDDQMANGHAWSTLSSQGELMNTYKSGKSRIDDPFRKQHMLNPESGSQDLSSDDPKKRMKQTTVTGMLPSIQDDHWKWFPAPPKEPEVSTVGTRQTQDFWKIAVQNQDLRSTDPSFQQEPNLLQSCQGYRKSSDMTKFRADSSTQPVIEKTMRLMGKDVIVGKYNRGGETSDDGMIWSDKEIVAQHSPSDAFWIPCPQKDQSVKNNPQQFEDPPNLADDHRKQQKISASYLVSTDESHGSNVSRSCYPLTSKEFQCKISKSIVDINPFTRSFKMANEMTQITPQRRNASAQIPLSSEPCNHGQIHSISRPTSFSSSFQNQGITSFSNPTSSPTPAHLPQWLWDAKQEQNQLSVFPLDMDPYQIDMCGSENETELHPLRSSQKASTDPFIYRTASEDSPLSTISSSIPSLYIPSIAARRSTLIGNSINGDENKSSVGRESNYTHFKLLDKLNRKRLAPRCDDVARQVKKQNIAMLGNSRQPSGLRRTEQLSGCIPSTSSRYQEMPACPNGVADVDMVEIDHEKYGISPAPRSRCLEHGSKLGSLKLSAGARHVPNPNHNVYRVNSRPINFTVPSVTGTSSTTISATEKKDKQVFRF